MSLRALSGRASRVPATLPVPAAGDTISFESGHAFPYVLPDLTRAAEQALSSYRTETLQYGPRLGLLELRTWISEFLGEEHVDTSPDLVLVTNGAKQAIELVCRLLLDEGDSIVVTAPTYFSGIPIFRSFGAQFIEVGQDAEGFDVHELAGVLERLKRRREPLPKFIYHVPDYHNPTGITTSLERRKALIDLAASEQLLIVEDSPYRRIRFEGELTPSLKALDHARVVIHIGTFSKLIAPGLRIGWVTTSRDMIARMAHLKADAGSCPLTQRVILQFCQDGHLAAHIEQVRQTYRTHRDRMVAALRRHMPEASVEVPAGGYYLWLTLPAAVDGDGLARCAKEAGVGVLPGSMFFARPDAGHPKNHIRLAFTHAGLDEIDEGVRRLASAFRAMAGGAAEPVPHT